MKNISLNINGQTLIFDYRKFLFWKDKSTLIISDLHIGKITHFIKNGIPLPIDSSFNNLKTLIFGINDYQPEKIIFLGDLFHSNYNHEWDEWLNFLEHSKIDFTLVMGNHDKINFKIKNLKTINRLEMTPFSFTHFPDENSEFINMCGHIHPAFLIRGGAKQNLKLPCFYISEKQIIFPSFGEFTGYHFINFNSQKDRILVISPNKIFSVKK